MNQVESSSQIRKAESLFVCVEVFTAQSTQWGHVERGQFT